MWLGGLVLGGLAVTGIILAFPGPKKLAGARLSTEKAETVAQERPTAYGPKRKEVERTVMEFVRTAVARRDIEASYDLVAPSMKRGYTREHWAKGLDLPVPRYPAIMAISRLAYSFDNEVDLQVALWARKKQARPAVFDVTLSRVRQGGRSRWLVSSILPNGAAVSQRLSRANMFPAPLPRTASSSQAWLLIPALLFGLLLLVVGVLGIRSWHAGRLYRAYARQD